MSIYLPALATGALSFTVALAWNDAIHKTIRSLVPISEGPGAAARAALLYALVATLLVIAVAAAIDGASRRAGASPLAPAPRMPPIVQLWEPPAGPPARWPAGGGW